MTQATNVQLDAHSARFVEEQIASGEFTSAAEVVRAGLRLLEREQRVTALRAALIEGEQDGLPQPFDFDELLREAHDSVTRGE